MREEFEFLISGSDTYGNSLSKIGNSFPKIGYSLSSYALHDGEHRCERGRQNSHIMILH